MKNKKKYFYRLFLFLILLLVSVSCLVTIRDTKLIFSPSELKNAILGQTYEVTITISNNNTPVSDIYGNASELPPGLTLNYEEPSSTAVLSGIPEIAGEYEFIIRARCYSTRKTGRYGEHIYRLLVYKPPMPSITPTLAPIAPATLAPSPTIMIE